MAIMVQVKPDFSAFRQASVSAVMAEVGCDEATAEALLEHFVVLPR